MSVPLRICLVGATGLVGQALIKRCVGLAGVRLTAVARREFSLPAGALMEVLIADPANWGDAIAAARPDVVVCALGTTWKKAGRDEAAFRAVDQELVLSRGRWAAEAGARQFVLISAIGANPHSRAFYMRVKGETEAALSRLGLPRLDIVRPGQLMGARSEPRPMERVGQLLAPLFDALMLGKLGVYRSIHADLLAQGILALVQEKARGRFVHTRVDLMRVIRRRGDRPGQSRRMAAVD